MGKSHKLSGAQHRKKARTRKILSRGQWRGKRGRPQGQTERIKERQGWVETDFYFLVEHGAVDVGEPRWTDLKIAKLLLRDSLRKKYKLGECQYSGMHEDSLRRLITDIKNKLYEPKTRLRVREP
jgi:hypothetical protein